MYRRPVAMAVTLTATALAGCSNPAEPGTDSAPAAPHFEATVLSDLQQLLQVSRTFGQPDSSVARLEADARLLALKIVRHNLSRPTP